MNRRKMLQWTMASLPLVGLTQDEMLAMPPDRLPKVWPAGALDQVTLRDHYRLFTDLTRMAAWPGQEETLEKAEAIFQLLDAWRPAAPPEEEFLAVSRSTLEHARVLCQIFPTLDLIRKQGTLTVANPDRMPLSLTEGLIQPVLFRFVEEKGRLELTRLTGKRSDPYLACKLSQGEPVTVAVRVQPCAIIQGKLLEPGREGVWPGRVWCRGADGLYHHAKTYAGIPTVSEKPVVFRPAWRKLPFFYSDGTFEISLPPGKVEITLERGFEHPLVRKTIELQAETTHTVSLSSKRFVDMRDRGWIGGDTHVHWSVNSWDENEDPGLLRVVQRAEDVRVVNNLTLSQWRPGKPFVKPDHAPMGPFAALCDEDYLVQMGEEFRNDNQYGHINLLNLKELIHPISTGPGSGGDSRALDYPLNKTIMELARKQGAVICEAHNLGPFGASAVPIHVALGLCDCLDQLEPQHYYRFLDCGFRIGLGNGSDHPARLVGCCRVYVRSRGDLRFDSWVEGLRKGQTFTTSGPLLFLHVDDTDIGETLMARPGQLVRVQARALSRKPLGTFEVVSNNEIIKTIQTEETDHTFAFDLPLKESRWITARVSRGKSFDALSGPDIAHTSAIYVWVEGKPVFRPEAARWWIDNIRNHRERVKLTGNFANDRQRQEALTFADQGIARYQELIRQHQA